ncbi:hypothetical protein [Marinoscillum sp. MHG1-6]|uniref:hypothetical protein n=1 Tax=Marinoscillum sp. MHG1-6 TaxID=2959627 RepID=UPI0021573A4F|nr:hypothetical protein [Marinoscillum sp. MHG1-6]
MRKLYILFTLILLVSFGAIGQDQSAMEKIEAAKIALITERLELTPEQAEKFWPIYREYAEQQKQLKSEFQELKKNFDPNNATEEENKKILEQGQQLKQKRLNMERTYTERMQQVVTTRQLMNLRKAEDDFREMLIRRIREQNQDRQRLQEKRQRNDEQMQQRRF